MNRVSYAQLRQNVGSLHIVPCGMSRSSRPGVLLPIRCAAAARLPDHQAFLGRRPAPRQQLKVLPAVQTEKGSIAGIVQVLQRGHLLAIAIHQTPPTVAQLYTLPIIAPDAVKILAQTAPEKG